MEFAVTADESWQFARLSGDFNPLHVDPVEARRLQFGGTVCHGVHLVLRALEAATGADLVSPDRIDTIGAVFAASVHTGTLVALSLSAEDRSHRLKLVARADGRVVFTARLTLSANPTTCPSAVPGEPWEPAPPHCPEFPTPQSMHALSSHVPLRVDTGLCRELFPVLSQAPMGLQWIADLAATTRIVGMACPGLHSIYSEFKLARREPAPAQAASEMPFVVQRADPRFRSVRIGVLGNLVQGTLEAFFRAPPVQQASLSAIAGRVEPARFAGQNALVVGGSRGLGEMVAKLLLTGGARVSLTYARGQRDAERICGEAAELRLPARAMYLDVRAPLPAELKAELATGAFTHLYHFATPQIAKGPVGGWSSALFDEFCDFYVLGFAEVVRATAHRTGGIPPLQVLYPSTVFLDRPEKGFAEYCASKAAGEALADHLATEMGIVVHRPRLPRMQTDQNSSFMGVEGEDPFGVMLALLERMQPKLAPAALGSQGTP